MSVGQELAKLTGLKLFNIEQSCDIFREKDAEIYFVDLEAELWERLKRNESEFRLSQKRSKLEIENSRRWLLADEENHKLNSEGEFCYLENYLKLENTNLSASDAAMRIVEAFGLTDAGTNAPC